MNIKELKDICQNCAREEWKNEDKNKNVIMLTGICQKCKKTGLIAYIEKNGQSNGKERLSKIRINISDIATKLNKKDYFRLFDLINELQVTANLQGYKNGQEVIRNGKYKT